MNLINMQHNSIFSSFAIFLSINYATCSFESFQFSIDHTSIFPNSTDSGPSMKIHVVGKPQKIRNNNGIKKKESKPLFI